MKMRYLILEVGILLLFFNISYSQSENQFGRLKLVGLEASLNSYSGEIENTDKIRANISYFDSNANGLESSFKKNYIGVKGELRNKNNKFALAVGIRYTNISSSTGNEDSPSSSFFYFLINNEGTTTEYLRVEEINQKSHYIGTPVEFRYFPFKKNNFTAYAKICFEFAYVVKSQIDVKFYDSSMASRQEELINKLKQVSSYYSSFIPAIGFEIGKKNKPSIGIELSTPSFFLINNVSALYTPDVGVGVQLNFQIPFNNIKTNKNGN